MNREAALYIGADPLTFNDIEMVKQSISTFGFITILLDRKNRDSEFKEYFLNYADRLDIIKHDLRELKIHDYQIIPIDETVQKTLAENHIQTLVLNLDYQKSISFRMMTILQEVCPDVVILAMHAPNYIERRFMKTIMDSDSTVTMYKKYCTDYSFFKFKLKTMKKIAMTGNLGSSQDILLESFRERGFAVVDLDSHLPEIIRRQSVADDFSRELAKHDIDYVHEVFPKGAKSFDKAKLIEICNMDNDVRSALEDLMFGYLQDIVAKEAVKTFNDYLIVNFSFLYELELESLFDTVICVHSSDDFQRKSLAGRGFSDSYINGLIEFQTAVGEKMEKSDFVFYGDKAADELRNNAIQFINSKLSRCCSK